MEGTAEQAEKARTVQPAGLLDSAARVAQGEMAG